LRREFFVRDEWGYVDRDTADGRTLDLYAERPLWDFDDQPRIRPELNLLVECKQSDLPYVFFLAPTRPHADFPLVVGTYSQGITLATDDDRSSWSLPVRTVLGLHELPFATDPPVCTTFSRAVRKGKDLELSGSDAFHGLVLPLLKALDFFERTRAPRAALHHSDLHLALALGVLDAPMIAVTVSGEEPAYELVP
jgi:hypothetical protein